MGVKCYVPGCRSGYQPRSSQGDVEEPKLKISFFRAPADMLDMWNKAIGRPDRPLTRKDAVCELHFDQADVVSHYCINLPDGSKYEEPRGRMTLAKGAVPRLFSNLNVRKECLRREMEKKELVVYGSSKKPKKEIKQLPPNQLETASMSSPITLEPSLRDDVQEISYLSSLHKEPEGIELPSKMWAVFQNENETIFAFCSPDMVLSKYVKFRRDSEIPEIFLNGVRVYLPEDMSSKVVVQELIKRVHQS